MTPGEHEESATRTRARPEPASVRRVLPLLDIVVDHEPDAETSLLAADAARELLRNVVEHADATRRVIPRTTGFVALTVTEDGRGFTPRRSAASGHGLRLLQRARAEGGGELTVTSNDGGTRVDARLPTATVDRSCPAPAPVL